MAQESWKRGREAGCQQPDGPIRCAKNCGFFGSSAMMNMCSKCYRDHVLHQAKEAAKASAGVAVSKPSQPTATRVELMDVDAGSSVKDRDAENDFMSGVQVLAGMIAEEKPSAMLVDGRPSTDQAKTTSSSPGSFMCVPTESVAQSDDSTVSGVASSSLVQQPNRCAACKKKVGLTGFKCRCSKVFCSTHRYSDKHNCSFDYKAAARDAIAKANPVVRGSKIDKI